MILKLMFGKNSEKNIFKEKKSLINSHHFFLLIRKKSIGDTNIRTYYLNLFHPKMYIYKTCFAIILLCILFNSNFPFNSYFSRIIFKFAFVNYIFSSTTGCNSQWIIL